MSKKSIGKEAKFLNALLSGRVISRKQAKAHFGLGNPSATVLRILDAGFTVKRQYAVTKSRAPGNKLKIRTVKYSIA